MAVRVTRTRTPDPAVPRLPASRVGNLRADERVYAEVWGRDGEPASQGLTAVFVDIGYDPAQFEVVSTDTGSTFSLFSDPSFDAERGPAARRPSCPWRRREALGVLKPQAFPLGVVDGSGSTENRPVQALPISESRPIPEARPYGTATSCGTGAGGDTSPGERDSAAAGPTRRRRQLPTLARAFSMYK